MEGGSLTEGREGGKSGRTWWGAWVCGWAGAAAGGCGWGGGLSKKPIVLDSTFTPTDARFPFILSV